MASTRDQRHGLAGRLLATAAWLAVAAGVVMLVWNLMVPELVAGPTLHFGQAVGLLVLCRLLLGGCQLHGERGARGRAACARRLPGGAR